MGWIEGHDPSIKGSQPFVFPLHYTHHGAKEGIPTPYPLFTKQSHQQQCFLGKSGAKGQSRTDYPRITGALHRRQCFQGKWSFLPVLPRVLALI